MYFWVIFAVSFVAVALLNVIVGGLLIPRDLRVFVISRGRQCLAWPKQLQRHPLLPVIRRYLAAGLRLLERD